MEKNTLIMTIAVVAIVIGAGAAFVVLNKEKSDDPYSNLKMVSLPVYGNANSDYVIDSSDVDLINDIASDESKWAEYPYADADGDGKITSDDAAIVQKLINGESTKVRFVDQYVYDTGTKRVVEVDYPLNNVITINPDMTQLTFVFDGDKKVAGYIGNRDSYIQTFKKIDNNGYSKFLGSTPRSIGAAEWSALKDLDVELNDRGQGIGAILAYNDAALGDYKDDLNTVGIPVIYIRCTDPIYSIDATMLLGFLFGPDYSKKAMDYANDSRQAIVDITEKVEALKDEDRVHFVALCMWKYMSQHESQYTKIGLQAGGIDEANLPGNGSDAIADVEAITKYNGKLDYILNCRTCDCTVVDTVTLWEDSRLDILKKSTEYDKMFFLNMSLPTPCRVMYTTAMFYPDIVSMNDANKYFQQMVDKYLPYLNDTVSDGDFNVLQDMTTVSTYKDYLDATGGNVKHDVESDVQILPLVQRFYELMESDLPDYSKAPYALSGDNNDQVAKVATSGEDYYVKYWLSETPKEEFEALKAVYEAKVGTTARVGGICTEIPYSNGLTEQYGYYVNSDIEDPNDVKKLGSLNYAGYYKEMVVELHIVKRPALEMTDIEKLIDACFPSDSDVSASAWASNVDLSSLSDFAGAPYSVIDGGTDLKAKIGDTEDKRYIEFDSSGSGYVEYLSNRAVYSEKAEGYVGKEGYHEMTVTGADEYLAYIVYRDTANFYMLYFMGMVDGVYVNICLRINVAIDGYTVDQANALINSILADKP